MLRLSRLMALWAALILGVAAAAPEVAFASPDAKIDQQIRPCFGLLIQPNLSHGCKVRYAKPRPCARGYYRSRSGRCVVGGGGYGPGGGRYVPREINCDYAYPGQVSDTLARLYDGDTITLTSTNGGACVESLNITQSVTIVVRGYQSGPGRPILVAPADQPCIKIAPGVEYVVLEGLGIESRRGGSASCIVGRATEIALKDVTVRYDGDASAFDIGDSRIELSNAVFIGRTRSAVVKATGTIMASDVEIAATAIGGAFETSGDSRLRDIRIVRLGDWTGSSRTRNSAGFVISGMNRQQLVTIDGLYVDGFSRGVYIGGGDETTLLRPVVRDSDWAVSVENANLRINDAELEAVDVGLYVASGVAYASNNKIVGVMRSGIYADAGGQIRAVDNRIYARKDGCKALVSGFFDGELTCRPWFEAPELYRTPRDRARLDYDTYWPAAPMGPTPMAANVPADLSDAAATGLAGGPPQQRGAPK
ncbi:hypothetical protein [Caulobacter sp. 1776]|uniref:hypothetical protein n=1 Tax=Caulobacter sp. 1776 TaxID=3156420 RepID=UPI00339ABAE7